MTTIFGMIPRETDGRVSAVEPDRLVICWKPRLLVIVFRDIAALNLMSDEDGCGIVQDTKPAHGKSGGCEPAGNL